MNSFKTIFCFVILLCFVGCKIDSMQDDVNSILESLNSSPAVMQKNEKQLKTNTDILLDIKDTVDKIAEEKNLQSAVTESCDCEDCKCDPCECGLVKSAEKKEIPKTYVTNWGSSISHYYVQKYTASWCAPCIKWNNNEKSKLLEGIQLKEFDTDIYKNKVSIVPYFLLKVWNGSEWVVIEEYSGYTTAKTLNDRVVLEVNKKNGLVTSVAAPKTNLKKKSYSQRLRTSEELRSWVANNMYLINQTQDADVHPRSGVWQHLTSIEHGFKRNQIKNLDMRTALLLHRASHGNIIGPYVWQ